MAVVFLLTWLAVAVSLWRRRAEPVDVESIAITGALTLTLVGLAAVGLALFGWFDATSMTLACATLTAVIWPWGRRERPRLSLDVRGLALGGLVVLFGLALRWPVADYALAGRDQGTYTLRAQHTLRTGRLDVVDPVLAAASAQAPSRSGPGDLLGLYPRRGDDWARDRYEGAYRPGLYLADRDRGHVVPQFFHLHPMLMATMGLVVGPAHVASIVLVEAALALLAIWAVARRLWRRGPWAWLATGLVVVSPLAIWVHRTALTEVPATMLLWTAVLGFIRGRPGDREAAALLFGATAWLRGHGWIVAPIVAAGLWRVPPGDRRHRRAGGIYVAMLVAAVFAHASTIYPYLHDELARQLPGDLHPGPGLMLAAAVAGALGWWAIDELWGARRPDRGTPSRAAAWLVAVAAIVVGAWWFARGAAPVEPFARLDPLPIVLGPVWLVVAAGGAARLWRHRGAPTADHAWLVAIAASVVATMALYAQRNLPQLHLYYYARYLAPEVLVAAALLATYGIEGLYRIVDGPGPRRVLAPTLAGIVAVGLVVRVAGVLLTAPVTRLPEFRGADRMLAHLESRLPPGAIVIAGGEGWHHGHTFNQVAGALALRGDVTVLPYRTREAAYATLHELLVARPAATATAAPPVFLLINETTKPYRPDDGGPVAGFDDGLWPPFSAASIDLVELYVDRLTPVSDQIPVRVTRDGLRMGLMHVVVDPARSDEVTSWPLDLSRPGPVTVRHAQGKRGPVCLRKKKRIVLDLPPPPIDEAGPVALVLVAAPGTARRNHTWKIEADGVPLSPTLPHAHDRDRDTLGPFVLPTRPGQLKIRGAKKATKGAPCPRGGIVQIRVLAGERSQLPRADVTALTFAPATDLGHPITPARWVPGRSLSRFRAGIRPTPQIRGLSLSVPPAEPITFARGGLPDEGRSPLDVLVTLARIDGSTEGATLRVSTAGRSWLRHEVPPARTRAWQTPATTVEPIGPSAALTLELSADDPDARIDVRDIGLFSRRPPIAGQLAP